jgi:glycosyltransferase involved in cell wall biosynthesis
VCVTHVLYLSSARGQNPFSGAENHVLTLVRELSLAGVDVELLVLVWQDSESIGARLAELAKDGVRVTKIERAPHAANGARAMRAIGVLWRLRSALVERRTRIIHLHLDLIALPVCARLARCKTLVFSIHNDEQYYRRLAWRCWLRFVDRWIAAYIAITRHVAGHFARCAGVAPERLEVIYYGVPASQFPPATRPELGLSEEAFVIGFVGRLTRQKDVSTLLRAVGYSRDIEAVVVGDGEERAELEKLALEVAPARVHFVGPRPNAVRFMPTFDVFCLPSRWEGLGLVLVEALHAGLPIVASRAGAVAEVLADGRFGTLCAPGDANEFAREFARLQNLPREQRADAHALRSHAESMFGVDAMVTRTIALYERVASGNP